jgi:hypothetical protein
MGMLLAADRDPLVRAKGGKLAVLPARLSGVQGRQDGRSRVPRDGSAFWAVEVEVEAEVAKQEK